MKLVLSLLSSVYFFDLISGSMIVCRRVKIEILQRHTVTRVRFQSDCSNVEVERLVSSLLCKL